MPPSTPSAAKRHGIESAEPRCVVLEEYIPYLVNRIAVRLIKNAAPHFKALGLTVAEWRILMAVRENPAIRFGALRVLTSLEPPTLSRLIGALCRRRLLLRRIGASDNRAIEVSLTDAGHALVTRSLPWADEVEDGILRGLAPAQVTLLRQILGQLHLNLAPDEDARVPPRRGRDKPRRK
jgi:MarR family transcriptional regulator, organic hydroperoxide resistance regulator